MSSTTAQQVTIRIPDTLRNWPWPRTINPYYEECKTESEAWIESFKVFGPKAQQAFTKCNFSLLSSLALANLNRDGCRIGCDLMHLFFVFDDFSDRSTKEETRHQAVTIMDALRNPHKPRPVGEFIGGRITQEYWLNAIKTTPASFQRRFIDTFQKYTDAVIEQSADREFHCQRDLQSYFALRRYTIGSEPSFVLNSMHMNLPDHVAEHPAIKRLEQLATDLIILDNDIVSYDREQSQPGQAEHNIISSAMASLNLSVQGAYDWVGTLNDGIVDDFISCHKSLPHFESESGDPAETETINRHVREYADCLGNWVRATDCWGFESQRYFGKGGPRIMKERTLVLRPQQAVTDAVEVAVVEEPVADRAEGVPSSPSPSPSSSPSLPLKQEKEQKQHKKGTMVSRTVSAWSSAMSFVRVLMRKANVFM